MKKLAKIAKFVLAAIAAEVCLLALCVLMFRMDLVVEILNAKPAIALMCLTVGATVGFLVGVLWTYYKLHTELNNKSMELKRLKKDVSKAEKFLDQILPEYLAFREQQKANSSKERKEELMAEIGDLSDIDQIDQQSVEVEADE